MFCFPQKTTSYESEVNGLKEKLNKTELLLSEITETTNGLKQKETTLKSKLDETQQKLDKNVLQSRGEISKLKVQYCIIIGFIPRFLG